MTSFRYLQNTNFNFFLLRFNYALKSTQLTHLLFLARSMCLNLSSTGCDPIPDESKFGELEHLRAYAGTYYLNTL